MTLNENPPQAASVVPAGGNAGERLMRQAGAAHRSGRLQEAVQLYVRLLQQMPHNAELHNNIGVALRGMGRFDAAIAHYRQSLAIEPNAPSHHSNLGNALRSINRWEDALQHHFRAVGLQADYVEGFFNLGLTLRDMGRLDEAIGCFGRVVQLAPDNHRAVVEAAVARLMRGDLEAGFRDYEVRRRLQEHQQPDFRAPAWDGGDIAGKTLLLYPEQGLADALQFARYAPLLRQRGIRLVSLVQPLLRDLFKLSGLFDDVASEGEPLPAFDYHASMLSLPALMGTSINTVPAQVPYLKAPELQRIRIGAHSRTRLKIGIFWAAMPGHPLDRNRSSSLGQFLSLADNPDVLVFSLQGGAAQKEIDAIGAAGLVHDVGRGIFDFAEAASVLTQLDLLITIDAPIAHLAGAMGLPAWVMLPHSADWRWMMQRPDSPWYPSLRLFRQGTPGDWAPVMSQIRTSLGALLSGAI
ncbi:MAG: tetratricopeptide repeat-containing glycosyltransferase family protein [Rhodospirillales bacterium]